MAQEDAIANWMRWSAIAPLVNATVECDRSQSNILMRCDRLIWINIDVFRLPLMNEVGVAHFFDNSQNTVECL